MAGIRNVRRICFVISDLHKGGMKRQFVALATDLARDHEVTVCCSQNGGEWEETLRDAGVYVRRVLSIPLPFGTCAIQTRRFVQLFWSHRPDIVHTMLDHSDLPVNRAARKTGVPVVISSRIGLLSCQTSRQLMRQRKANTLVNCVVVSSRAAAEHVIQREGLSSERVRIIPKGANLNGVAQETDLTALRRELQLPERARVVAMVADFAPCSGHQVFVEAAALLAKDLPDIHFLLVGEGPLRRRIERQINRFELKHLFTVIRRSEALPAWYQLMDVVVFPSEGEGITDNLLDAMAACRPVVAANVGDVPELISDNVHGRLVTSHEPAAYAETIRLLLDDPETARRLSEQAGKRIRETFSLENAIAQYRRLYNELLAHSVVLGG